jgi:hypothetical protein
MKLANPKNLHSKAASFTASILVVAGATELLNEVYRSTILLMMRKLPNQATSPVISPPLSFASLPFYASSLLSLSL